jgi:Tol biopolymer transport system component
MKPTPDVWMVSWDGKENVQLTNTMEDESSAKFSPDNKYISFLSSRNFDEDKKMKKMMARNYGY